MPTKPFITALVAVSAVIVSSAPVCQDILIPVNIRATNKAIPSNLTVANLTISVLQSLPNLAVSGDYVIGATYCEPETKAPSKHNTLQILIHGAAYTRTYWNSLGLDQSMYSWVDFASKQGYPTLAIDRLCNGLSSHPNGLLVCQFGAESEALHQLVQRARSGSLPIGRSSRAFGRIITVGHSIGADLVSVLAQTYPADSNASIFTGWSNGVINGVPTVLFGNVTRASLVYPDRFGNLSGDPSYVTFASKRGQSYLSYFGNFDQSVQDHDYATQGTFTLGEALTQILGQLPATKFSGPVLVLDGDEDATYCQPNLVAAAAMAVGNCSKGNAVNSKTNFPATRQFDSIITPDTGHCLNLHRTAQQSYQMAFNFLSRNGF